MSNYHVLAGREDGNAYRVAFHIPIPNANNRAGVNYRTALTASGLGGSSIMSTGTGPGQVATGEMNQITSGAIYEHVEEIETNPNETAVAYKARLDSLFTEYADTGGQLLAKIRGRIEYFGYTP